MACRTVGFTYVLSNPAMPGMVKVGYTTAQAEGPHPRSLVAFDHGFQEALAPDLSGEEVRPLPEL